MPCLHSAQIVVKMAEQLNEMHLVGKTVSRNCLVDLCRFLFMTVVCLWHFKQYLHLGWLAKGYIVVDFFFILSGFLIHRSFQKHNYPVFAYIWKRIKHFFPEYFFALITTEIITIQSLLRNSTDLSLRNVIYSFIAESLFVQSIGLPNIHAVNYPCWYLSVLIFGGGIVYALLKVLPEKSVVCSFAVVSFSLYALLLYPEGSLERWNGFYPMVRGTAGLSAGIAISNLVQKASLSSIKKCRIALMLTSFALASADVIGDIFPDSLTVLIWCVLVFTLFIEDPQPFSSTSSKVIQKLGEISYEMLLLHVSVLYAVVSICGLLNVCDGITLTVFLVATILASYLTNSIFNKLNLNKK